MIPHSKKSKSSAGRKNDKKVVATAEQAQAAQGVGKIRRKARPQQEDETSNASSDSETQAFNETRQDMGHASSSDSSDTSDDGVDEEGMERLMTLIGDDGLDEFDQAQLATLGGGDSEEDDEDDQSLPSEANDEEEELVALDDLDEHSVDEDAVPTQKIEIDNKIALERIRDTIKFDASIPWTETLSVTYPHKIKADVDDDTSRELAFYKQALHGANSARTLAAKHKFPFTRPSDYFAEMVKSDSHMERIRQRLLDEDAGIKKSEAKKRERDGKKFGKQVQVEKLKEREKSKKDMDDRLKSLKRKRKGALENAQADDDAFDIAVEDAISDRPAKRGRGGASRGGLSRRGRDSKFGFGGAGRRSKQNTKESTDDFVKRGGFGGGNKRGQRGRGGSGAKPRLGKSKRMAGKR